MSKIREPNITDIPTIERPHMAIRLIITCQDMFENKQIKPSMQWAALIFPILLTYTSKSVYSIRDHTPNKIRKQ